MEQPSAEVPVYKRLGIEIVAAEGMVVRTRAGAELLDFYGGHAVCALGHSHPAVVGALRLQMETLLFQTNLVDLEIRRQACERLAVFSPPGLESVFLVNSGAEANENALRLACRATGRGTIVAFEGAFHGRTAAAGACTWGSERWYGFPAKPFRVRFVPVGDLAALEAAIDEDTAAVIVEPIQGVAGAVDLGVETLRAVRRITEARGAWMIADEVQCGMGRSGHAFAVDLSGVVPDALTTAKALGGGFPCGALLLNRAAAAGLGIGDLGTTFGGGPLACAAILAVLDVMEDPGFMPHVQAMAAEIQARAVVGPVRRIQGRGLLLGLELSRPAAEVLPELRALGILAGGASDPAVVRLMPPLTMQVAHVDALVAALAHIRPGPTEAAS